MFEYHKKIRWQQRYNNLTRAFAQLEKGTAIIRPSDIEQQGIIQSFEFTFELSWKTVKDYLESEGFLVKSPRETLKLAFQQEMLADGVIWMDMLEKRNLIAHTYDEKLAQQAYDLIVKGYFMPIKELVNWLGLQLNNPLD